MLRAWPRWPWDEGPGEKVMVVTPEMVGSGGLNQSRGGSGGRGGGGTVWRSSALVSKSSRP